MTYYTQIQRDLYPLSNTGKGHRETRISGFTYRCKGKEQIDLAAVCMIQNHPYLPFVPFVMVDEKTVQYQEEHLCPFAEYIEQGLDKKRIWSIVREISHILYESERYFLTPEHIQLTLSYLFIDLKTDKLYVTYLPVMHLPKTELMMAFTQLLCEIWSLTEYKKNSYFNMGEYRNPIGNTVKEETVYGRTMVFEQLQEAAEKSKKRIAQRKAGMTTYLPSKQELPFLIRKKNGEKIQICGNIFKLGKDQEFVDYCIKDNPAISKSHADILKKDQDYYLVDQCSLNATMLNGRKIPPKQLMKLHATDCIILANERFDFYRNESVYR